MMRLDDSGVYYTITHKMYSAKMTEKYERYGKKWDDDEVATLLKEIHQKFSLEKIAALHQRSVGGIKKRIYSIAADYHEEGRTMEEIMRFTGLTKEEVENAIEYHRHCETLKKERVETRKTSSKSKDTGGLNNDTVIDLLTEIRDMMKEIMLSISV